MTTNSATIDMPATASAPPNERLVKLSNVLASGGSAHLRSHKANPVAWQEWNSSSIALAKASQRLIFLSIGYSACHWCHVMERESFSAPEVAELLNHHFIPIKVDREARPDLDEIYMSYVTATTGSGGWPLNVFLTPNLEPVFGGTYWPGPHGPVDSATLPKSDGRLTFVDILKKMQDVWSTQRERCLQSAEEITQHLKDRTVEGRHSHSSTSGSTDADVPEPLDIDIVDDAFDHFVSRYDPLHGGFSASTAAPKFPSPASLTFLLRIGASTTSTSTHFGFPDPIPAVLGTEACNSAASMSLHTLRAMSRSGLRDHLGYGFHRYSVTSDWNVPHFEKMLYDNAQLLACFCDAWALSRDPEILGALYSLVGYFTASDSPIVDVEGGGFFASQDADSSPSQSSATEDRREGAFYVWTLKELHSVLQSETSANIVARHYGMTADGNVPHEHDVHDEFMNQNVLHVSSTPPTLAMEFGLPEENIVKTIKDGRQKLREHRQIKRRSPDVDDKIITAWNALAIVGLCRASDTLKEFDPVGSEKCKATALKTAHRVRAALYDEDSHMLRRYCSATVNSQQQAPSPPAGYLDDYAYMTQACLALYAITFEEHWLRWAEDLQIYINEFFTSHKNAYNLTSSRPRSRRSDSNTSHQGRHEGKREDKEAQAEEEEEDGDSPLIDIKPGSDNAYPSPNGIVAINLLLLESYLQKPCYGARAKQTIDAFSVEIIQHPFLFVSMQSANILQAVGIQTVVVIGEETQVLPQAGFRRVVIGLHNKLPSRWLIQSNPLLRGLDLDTDAETRILICEGDRCRETRIEELDAHDVTI